MGTRDKTGDELTLNDLRREIPAVISNEALDLTMRLRCIIHRAICMHCSVVDSDPHQRVEIDYTVLKNHIEQLDADYDDYITLRRREVEDAISLVTETEG